MLLFVWLLAQAASGSPGAPAVAERCRPSVARALPLLAAADAASAKRDTRTANDRLDAAIAALGTTYRRPTTIDDSGMRLVLARSQERKGLLTKAALLKRRVLAGRLGHCGVTIAR